MTGRPRTPRPRRLPYAGPDRTAGRPAYGDGPHDRTGLRADGRHRSDVPPYGGRDRTGRPARGGHDHVNPRPRPPQTTAAAGTDTTFRVGEHT
ncbi:MULTISPECIES: hypothetical protein [unclassified Streptomyces]|uniref:hypothetical protein n=1 Tax=unclassified Streptomyces TaxID=2593676 RepID=UPI00381EC071